MASSVQRTDKYKTSRNSILNMNTYNMADGFTQIHQQFAKQPLIHLNNDALNQRMLGSRQSRPLNYNENMKFGQNTAMG